MIDQDKIHQQCLSDEPKECIEGLKQLEDNYSLLPDKQKAWDDLIRLTVNKEWEVRSETTHALGFAYSEVPEKQKAWEDL
ncbi:hypothetical protein ACSAZL_04525 [Methanosarcina sp. T3]|uniref:hypothetical protein n=1 Tax=Methanosarcina sp. T3 TaxID=3439062 RepID=UPI003F874BE2